MSLSITLFNALSGLQTNQSALQVVSSNVANVNTPDYTRKVHEQQTRVLDGLAVGDEPEELEEIRLQGLGVGRLAPWPHPEDVDDLARCDRGRPPAHAPGQPGEVGRLRPLPGVDVPRLDVEAVSGQQPADDGELGEVVEGDDRDVVSPFRPGLDAEPYRLIACQLRGETRVPGRVLREDARVVLGIESTEELQGGGGSITTPLERGANRLGHLGHEGTIPRPRPGQPG